MDTTSLINYLETLRYQRKLTQEEYLHDIISQRQFYRYTKGESEVPFEVIDKLIERLGIPYLNVITQFTEETKKDKKLVQEYFNLVMNKKYQEAECVFERIDKSNLIDDDSISLAKAGKAIYTFYKGFFSKLELCTQLKENMKYDMLIRKETYHDFEIYLLGLIMEYSEKDRPIILKKLIQVLTDKKMYIRDNMVYMMQVYFWVIKQLGRDKKYNKVIYVAEKAIFVSNKYYSFYCLNYFHYYKALAHKKLNQMIEFEEDLYKAIILCFYRSKDRDEKFVNTIYKDTGINGIDFVKSKCKSI